jgi:two-component system, chemotaxis family, sensor kinase CheA
MQKDPLAHLPPEVRTKMREYFLEEAYPLVDQLEADLLALEKNDDPLETLPGTINEAFRAAHTIKGSAASTGFGEIAQLTHEFETALDVLRSDNQLVSSEKVILLLEGIDHIRRLLSTANEDVLDDTSCDSYILNLKKIFQLGQLHQSEKQMEESSSLEEIEGANESNIFQNLTGAELELVNQELKSGAKFYSLFWILPENAFALGLDPYILLNALADEAKIIRATPLIDKLPPLGHFDPGLCYIGLSCLVTTLNQAEALRAVFEFCPEDSFIEITPLKHQKQTVAAPIVGEMASEDSSKNIPAQVNSAKPHREMIRVKPERLDSVMNLVGELITASNGLSHLQNILETEKDIQLISHRLKTTSDSVNWIVNRLQSDVLSLRMVAMDQLFQRMKRTLYDIAKRQGKNVRLQLSGEETEVDKTVADALMEPLMHLIRNAVDHGIETPEERIKAGKPEEGCVTLSATLEGNTVIINIKDDGAGIDVARIKEIAVSKGMITLEEAETLSDTESRDLIFAAGFSTADKITDISGRGVGMDVVRNNITRIGGSVKVDSQLGQGSNITLELPLSLSLFRGLVMKAGGETYILPLDSVRETTLVQPSACGSMYGKPVFTFRGKIIGLVHLTDVMGVKQDKNKNMELEGWPVVVVESRGKQIGLIVDHFESPQDIVVKPVDESLSVGGLLAGAFVMGNGKVALVFDINNLVRSVLDYAQNENVSR